jgi:lipopolysaccharide heptosyltransferase III
MDARDSSRAGRDASRAADPWRRLRRSLRRPLLLLAALGSGGGSAPLPDLRACRRILLVNVNQRLGNTVLPSGAVAALADALPQAELHFVGGSPAPAVLRGLRLASVLAVARSDPWKPWRLLSLVRAIRRLRCDAAIHLSTATGSLGALLVAASGAPHRIGVRRADGSVLFTSAVEEPPATHKVDQLAELVGLLGIPAASAGERRIALSADERAFAARSLEEWLGGEASAPVALFVGGRARKGKGWPLEAFARVAAGLRAQKLPVLVFLGPEELARGAEIRAALGPAHYVEEPDLRRVAALLAACRAVLTPDSGPMHLAIAAGAPTVAVFARANSERWGPRPPRGRAVFDPDGSRAGEVLDAVLKACAGAA